MNRRKYSKTFLSTVDIIAAFFTDVFINELYYKSKDRASHGASVTEEYKKILSQYAYGVSNDASSCKHVVSLLHKYYSTVTKYSTITYYDFENTILRQFIPSEYYQDFTSKNKTDTMGAIIIKTVQNAIVYILNVHILNYIIDCRDIYNQDYILRIQDHIAETLMTQREEFYIDFAKKINEKAQKVPIEIVYKMRDELKSQVEKRIKIENERDKAISMIYQLLEKLNSSNNNVDACKKPNGIYAEESGNERRKSNDYHIEKSSADNKKPNDYYTEKSSVDGKKSNDYYVDKSSNDGKKLNDYYIEKSDNNHVNKSKNIYGNEYDNIYDDKFTDVHIDKFTDKSIDKFIDKPTDKFIDKFTDKPADKPTDKPANKFTDKPADKSTDKSADKPADKPTDKSADDSFYNFDINNLLDDLNEF